MPSLYMVQVPLPIVPKCLYQQVYPLEAVAVSAFVWESAGVAAGEPVEEHMCVYNVLLYMKFRRGSGSSLSFKAIQQW